MSERKPMTLGERWRREATRGIDDRRLAAALEVLPSVRKPMVRIRTGSIHAEMEGSMGSIHEVSLHVRTLPGREPTPMARVLRRSRSIVEALEQGRVPRAFDRLVARVCGEPLFPESRRITWGCTCDLPDQPCHHVLALHELFARRLEERPWELITLRGIDLNALLAKARQTEPEPDHPPLPFGCSEEPVLYPDGEGADLDNVLTPTQVRWLVGLQPARFVEAGVAAVARITGNSGAGPGIVP